MGEKNPPQTVGFEETKSQGLAKGSAPSPSIVTPEEIVDSVASEQVTVSKRRKGPSRKERSEPRQKSGDPSTAAKGDIFELAVGGGKPAQKLKLEDLSKVIMGNALL